jgi:hypothetical protein
MIQNNIVKEVSDKIERINGSLYCFLTNNYKWKQAPVIDFLGINLVYIDLRHVYISKFSSE